jgi:hypothetical protein
MLLNLQRAGIVSASRYLPTVRHADCLSSFRSEFWGFDSGAVRQSHRLQ